MKLPAVITLGALALAAGLASWHFRAQTPPTSRESTAPAKPPRTELRPELMEGTWVRRGVRNNLGVGEDVEIILRQENGVWKMVYTVTTYPSVKIVDEPVQRKKLGPYTVMVRDGVMQIPRAVPPAPREVAFLCDEKRLVMPAMVRKGGTFQMGYFFLQCAADPESQPVGSAEFPMRELGPVFYLYEKNRYGMNGDVPVLRLCTRDAQKGFLVERARLVFEDPLVPQFISLDASTKSWELEFAKSLYFAVEKEKGAR